jgi:glycosyltransferase involved in cell wall biosynthesis
MSRVGINALYLIPGEVGGTEIYLRELLAALAGLDTNDDTKNEYFVFTNMETGADLVPRQANFHSKPQAIHARRRPARILWEQIVLPIEASRYRLDVMFNPGFTAPILAPCACVTVFHDLQHKRHPEYFRWYDLPFWRLLLWASARRSRTLIAVSEATREDLLRYYPFTRGHLAVIPHGVDESFFALDRSKIEPYVLCVSTLHPHKNLERLIRAYARKKRDFKLVIAGMRGFHSATLDALIADLSCGDVHGSQASVASPTSVRLTGWIPRDQLMRLYAGARAFIYPSTFEGFGMPVLEAMAAGIPVACSDIPPLREVADNAALFFDPSNEDTVAAALDRITSDDALRLDLSQAGPQRARGFTWNRAAIATAQAMSDAGLDDAEESTRR